MAPAVPSRSDSWAQSLQEVLSMDWWAPTQRRTKKGRNPMQLFSIENCRQLIYSLKLKCITLCILIDYGKLYFINLLAWNIRHLNDISKKESISHHFGLVFIDFLLPLINEFEVTERADERNTHQYTITLPFAEWVKQYTYVMFQARFSLETNTKFALTIPWICKRIFKNKYPNEKTEWSLLSLLTEIKWRK